MSVWALSRDQKVWFRNGVKASSSGDNENLAKGAKWIEMVGEMKMISVGPGDQVTKNVLKVLLSSRNWKLIFLSEHLRYLESSMMTLASSTAMESPLPICPARHGSR